MNAPAYPQPTLRRLRVYAFDPQAAVELDTAVINDAVIALPWETPWEEALGTGPTNDYLEVVDFDPACGLFYAPVNLNEPALLAQDGLAPSEGRPQFHQQMVFAVAMRTIRAFERALGRPVLWAGTAKKGAPEFTPRLRIYPHALREANAYYSPDKTALLFGYFKAPSPDAAESTTWIFTCLSQDIVAHETTHAILHGIERRSVEPTSIDTLAFHEAFADIVALLQHFSMPEVTRQQLARSGGSLRERSLLNGLARQFGQATGLNGSLRYALEIVQGEAEQAEEGTSPFKIAIDARQRLGTLVEPHARGGVLVAAVFDAFVTIYETRSADLMRLGRAAFGGPGALPPDLVGRLAAEAGKAAQQVLRMCVRALDYVPPVDLRFGEYLRAIITADADLVPDDPMRYRVAFVEAFRKRGITAPGCISMAPDSLMWDEPDTEGLSSRDAGALFASLLAQLQLGAEFVPPGSDRIGFVVGDEPGPRNLRDLAMRLVSANQAKVHRWFDQQTPDDAVWEKLLGIRLQPRAEAGAAGLCSIREGGNGPIFDVHSTRVARRQGPDGETLNQLIIQITQSRAGYYDPARQAAVDQGQVDDLGQALKDADFTFRGGATLLVDLRDGSLRRIIRKRIDDDDRLAAQRAFLSGDGPGAAAAFHLKGGSEPFALVHRSTG